MKKWFALFMAVMMVAVLSASAMASTIGVNVTPGFTADVFKQLSPQSDPFAITGMYGLNEQLLFKATYTTSDPSEVQIGARYAFTENLAATLDFVTSNSNRITAGVRYRYNATDKLDLAGQLDYFTDKDNNTGTNLLAQAEYKLADFVTVNAGYQLANAGNVSSGSIVIGGEFHPDEHWLPYIDYHISADAGGTNYLLAGVSYKI